MNNAIYTVTLSDFTDSTNSVYVIDSTDILSYCLSIFQIEKYNFTEKDVPQLLFENSDSFIVINNKGNLSNILVEYDKMPLYGLNLTTGLLQEVDNLRYFGNNLFSVNSNIDVLCFADADGTYQVQGIGEFYNKPEYSNYVQIDITSNFQDKLGFSNARYDSTLYAIGAPGGQYVLIFELQPNGYFQQIQRIDSTDEAFGFSLAFGLHENIDQQISEDTTTSGVLLAVGSPRSETVNVYLKLSTDSTFSYLDTIVNDFGTSGIDFGYSVVIIPRHKYPFTSNGYIVIGAPHAEVNANYPAQGTIRFYRTYTGEPVSWSGAYSNDYWNPTTSSAYYLGSRIGEFIGMAWAYNSRFEFLLVNNMKAADNCYPTYFYYDTGSDSVINGSTVSWGAGLYKIAYVELDNEGSMLTATVKRKSGDYRVLIGSAFSLRAYLYDPDGNDFSDFGECVDMDDEYIYVSAPRATVNGYVHCGAIYGFDKTAVKNEGTSKTHTPKFKLIPDTPADYLYFGSNFIVDKERRVHIVSLPEIDYDKWHNWDNLMTADYWSGAGSGANSQGRYFSSSSQYTLTPAWSWNTDYSYAPTKFKIQWGGYYQPITTYPGPDSFDMTINNHLGVACWEGTLEKYVKNMLWDTDPEIYFDLDLSGGFLGSIIIDNTTSGGSESWLGIYRLEFSKFGVGPIEQAINDILDGTCTLDVTIGEDITTTIDTTCLSFHMGTDGGGTLHQVEPKPEIIVDYTSAFSDTTTELFMPDSIECLYDGTRVTITKISDFEYENPGLSKFYYTYDTTYSDHKLFKITIENNLQINTYFNNVPCVAFQGYLHTFEDILIFEDGTLCPIIHVEDFLTPNDVISTNSEQIYKGIYVAGNIDVTFSEPLMFDRIFYFTPGNNTVSYFIDDNTNQISHSLDTYYYPDINGWFDDYYVGDHYDFNLDMTADTTSITSFRGQPYSYSDRFFFIKDKKHRKKLNDTAIFTSTGLGNLTFVPTYYTPNKEVMTDKWHTVPDYLGIHNYTLQYKIGINTEGDPYIYYPKNAEGLEFEFSHKMITDQIQTFRTQYDYDNPPIALYGHKNDRSTIYKVERPLFFEVNSIKYEVDATIDQTTIDEINSNYAIRINDKYYDGTNFIDSTEYNTLGEIIDLTGDDFTGINGLLKIDMTPGPDPKINLLKDFTINGLAIYVENLPNNELPEGRGISANIEHVDNYAQLDADGTSIFIRPKVDSFNFNFYNNDLDLYKEKKGII